MYQLLLVKALERVSARP